MGKRVDNKVKRGNVGEQLTLRAIGEVIWKTPTLEVS